MVLSLAKSRLCRPHKPEAQTCFVSCYILRGLAPLCSTRLSFSPCPPVSSSNEPNAIVKQEDEEMTKVGVARKPDGKMGAGDEVGQ